MSFNSRHILITGLPGIGKTTTIKRVIDTIKLKHSDKFFVKGFYTQEVRSANGERIGFDVIDINSESNRKPLSRIDFKFTQKVGKYSVDINSFESIAIPLMTVTDFDIKTIEETNKQLIIVIDEIGKMEAFGDIFRKGVKQLFDSEVSSKSYRILASIPVKRNVQMVEEIRSKYANREIHINRSNRNQMADRVVNMLCETAIR